MKSLKILSNNLGEDDKEYVEATLELLKFFIRDNVDNSKLLLSDVLFEFISEIPYIYSKSVFELIYQAISSISYNQVELHSSKSIIERIYKYLIKTNVLKNLKYIDLLHLGNWLEYSSNYQYKL